MFTLAKHDHHVNQNVEVERARQRQHSNKQRRWGNGLASNLVMPSTNWARAPLYALQIPGIATLCLAPHILSSTNIAGFAR